MAMYEKDPNVGTLIIARRKQETVLIGDDIKVTVTSIGDDAAILAIEAPKKTTILRKELLTRSLD